MMIPLIDREVFFGNPEIISAQISPDGLKMSFIKPYEKVRNIWVKEIDSPIDSAIPITHDTRPISAYFWSRDNRYILYAQDKNGDENYHIYRVDIQNVLKDQIPEAIDLTPYPEITAMIYKRSKKNPDLMFIGLNHRDKSWHDLYQLSISTGKHDLIYQNDDFVESYLFDLEDQLRIVSRPNAQGGRDVLTYQDDALNLIFSSTMEETVVPLRFHPNRRQVYILTNQGNRDKTELTLFDLSSQEEELVHRDPLEEADLEHADFAYETEKLLYTVYETDQPRYYFFDDETEKDLDYIKNQLAGKQISITSSNL
jgi:dipeptidyl aminopeptidase/acylaminoacyl peptidase